MRPKHQRFRLLWTLLSAITVLITPILNTHAQPISQSQTNSALAQEQQKQNNALALEAAKKLSISFSEQENSQAAETLNQICESGLVTNPEVIPYLIEALKLPDHRSEHLLIGENALRALCLMTRRMSLDAAKWEDWRPPAADDSQRRNRVIAWWEDWWKNNQNKHPIYDDSVDQIVWNTFLNIEKIIEERVKPNYPELGFFKAGIANSSIPIPHMYFISALYEYQYQPYLYDQGVYDRSRNKMFRFDELPWLEIKCQFDDQSIAGYWIQNPPPKQLEKFLTTVYSKKIEDTGIFVEVRIASSNTALVDDLKKELNP